MVSPLDLLAQRHLCVDPRLRLLGRQTVAGHEPRALDVDVDCDHDDRAKVVRPSRLEEQRGVVDDEGRARLQGLGQAQLALGRDERMGELLERPSRLHVGEDHGAERRPIKGAVWPEHAAPESLDDARETDRAGHHDLAGHLVGVDDMGTAFLEQPGDRALASGDASGQADQQRRHDNRTRLWHPRSMRRLVKWIVFLALLVGLCTMVPEVPSVRARLMAPLRLHVEDAQGDAAYVLAGGLPVMFERLMAAADLYHMKRVPRIVLGHNRSRSSHNFVAGEPWMVEQWMVGYLEWLGVPKDKIELIDVASDGLLSTLAEARAVKNSGGDGVKTWVVVSSPAQMCRVVLAFERTLPDRTIVPYAATELEYSSEFHHPMFWEYFKLLVYWTMA